MRSSYKKIGSFVKQVNVRNKELSVKNLQGININKFFMPSVANTNGTDLSKYKVVAQKQFAFNPMHVGRDEVLPISMLEEEESVIVSPAYAVFKVKDETQLLPEYLMMWCRRPEFDRNAWFTTDSSVRGGFSWKDFCDLTLPVPTIEKQRDIVREYHTIVDRIKLNEQLNQKLEKTAQAIYKQWFVDFEFPISKEHAAEIGKPELEGKPYKSSDGKMVWNDELDQEIPDGWKPSTLGYFLSAKGYIRGPFGSALLKEEMTSNGMPVYEQQHAIHGHRNFRYFITEDKYKNLKRFSVKPFDMVISCSGTLGRVTMIQEDDPTGIINQALLILRTDRKKISPVVLKYYLTSPNGHRSIVTNSGGSAQVNIAKREIIENIPMVSLQPEFMKKVTSQISAIDRQIQNIKKETELLESAQILLLAKMTKAEATA